MRAWQVEAYGEPAEALRLAEVAAAGARAAAASRAGPRGPGQLPGRAAVPRRSTRSGRTLPFTPGRRAVRRGRGRRVGGDRLRGRRPGGRQLRPAARLVRRVRADGRGRDLPGAAAWTTRPRRAFIIAYQTGWFGLHRRAHLQPGETLLVHAAAGGVGSAAVQLGKAAGARVDRASSAGRTRPRWRARSAPTSWSTGVREDFVAAVKEATGGRGADVIYDPVGGDAYAGSTKCVAFEGRILVVGFAGGTMPTPRAQPRAGQELLDPRPALGALQAARPAADRGPRTTELLRRWPTAGEIAAG